VADPLVVVNVPQVAQLLRDAPEQLIPLLRQAVERWQLRRAAVLARYPSAPPGSTYRRTGTLGRLWTSSRPTWSASRSGFESRLGNRTPYGPYVQGERQASFHRGSWRRADEEGQQAQPELEREVQGAVRQVEAQINGAAS
jgi:hypothetical protein